MPTLHILTEGFPQKSFPLQEGVTTIGRDDDNAIHIPDASLSGNHGQFVVSGGNVVFQDLESTNGSFVDEQQIQGEIVIPEGTVFRLASVYMQIGNGHIQPDKTKRTTALIQVAPAGIKPDELESKPEEIESPFKTKKGFGGKIMNIIIILMFVAAIGVLGYTLWKASGSG